MAVAAPDILAELREKVRRIEARIATRTGCMASGRPEVDRLLPGGGFPRGALSEIAGGRASGKTAIALAAIARATREQGLAAFVDGRHELYPPAAAALGVSLDRLLILRPGGHGTRDAALTSLWAAEALLGSGAFEVVALDVALEAHSRRTWGGLELERAMRRLRAAAEKGGCVGLWLGHPGLQVPSAVRVDLAPGDRGASSPAVVVHHAA